ncbi:MAG: hypothetical protein Kow00108_01030 [Calditrichia bacterium]
MIYTDDHKILKWIRLAGIPATYLDTKDTPEITSRAMFKSVTNYISSVCENKVFINEYDEVKVLEKLYRIWPDLKSNKPLSICSVCNRTLLPVRREEILNILPSKVKIYCNEFNQCPGCNRLYWDGTHVQKIMNKIKKAME